MGKKGVEEILTEIDVFIDNCKSQPFLRTILLFPEMSLRICLMNLSSNFPMK